MYDLIKCKIENEDVVMNQEALSNWFIKNSADDGTVQKTIVLYDTVNNNAPIISGLLSANTYSIKVKSIYPNGLESDFSNILTVTTL